MPIHFQCVKCGKRMFAQEQYAGQHVNCPECRAGNIVPPAEGVSIVNDEDVGPAPSAKSRPVTSDAADSHAERDELFPAPPRRGFNPAGSSISIWRTIARVAVMVSTTWMIFLAIAMLQQEDPPYFALIFDVLLIAGLTLSRVQMRNGPYHVFLVGALAVALSMPLLSQMGFVLIDEQSLKYINEHRQPGAPEVTLQLINNFMWVALSVAGVILAIPIAIAGMKIAGAAPRKPERRP